MLRWKHNEKTKVRDIKVTNEDPIYSPNLSSNYFHIVSRMKESLIGGDDPKI